MNRYQKLGITALDTGKRYIAGAKYPEIPLSEKDLYFIMQEGDRLDLLANQIYGDPSLWWIISSANSNLKQNSLYVPTGTQIRVPLDVTNILLKFDQINGVI